MMHAHSGNLSDRCSFSRSTTLQAAPSLPEVALTVVWSENHRKSKILPVVDLFRDFQVTQEGTRPLWKSIRPMQFFTLYNFASSTVAPWGGHHSRLGRTGLKNDDFQGARESLVETVAVKFTSIHGNMENITEKEVGSCQWVTIGVGIFVIGRIIEVGDRDWVSDEVQWIRGCSACIVGVPSSIREKPDHWWNVAATPNDSTTNWTVTPPTKNFICWELNRRMVRFAIAVCRSGCDSDDVGK